MRLQVSTHLSQICNAAILFLPAVALLGKLLEVQFRRLVADGDVDLALRKHKVRDLVIPPLRQPLLFEMVLRIHMVYVTAVKQEILSRDVSRQKTPVAEL